MKVPFKPYQGIVCKKGHPEHDLQSVCVAWFRMQFPQWRTLLFAIPNGGSRNQLEAVRLQSEGVTAGVSDLIFLSPYNGALLIEMKTAKGYQTPTQKEWEKAVTLAGYRYSVCKSLEDFQNVIHYHLQGRLGG